MFEIKIQFCNNHITYNICNFREKRDDKHKLVPPYGRFRTLVKNLANYFRWTHVMDENVTLSMETETLRCFKSAIYEFALQFFTAKSRILHLSLLLFILCAHKSNLLRYSFKSIYCLYKHIIFKK